MKTYARFLYLAFGLMALSMVFVTAGFGIEDSCDPSNCRKCHVQIYEEFTTTGAHTSLVCDDCHQNSDLDYSVPVSFNLSWLDVPVDTPHSAISVMCVDCHPNVLDELQDGLEAHRRFYMKSLELAVTPNAACIACHTHTDVNFKPMRKAYVSYDVSCDRNGYNVQWNESDELGTNRTDFAD
ncbi:MAG: hypothetical protein U9N46_06395 [Euryarchaeota archaeon]|nr:hypothetical protein [Euryarchaeota archaeon]